MCDGEAHLYSRRQTIDWSRPHGRKRGSPERKSLIDTVDVQW